MRHLYDVIIIGGGPGGLSAAYFLSLMGHRVVVYDQRPQLGGMLRYGIPDWIHWYLKSYQRAVRWL